jgi:hypothetical protein
MPRPWATWFRRASDPDDDYEDEHEENEGRNEDLDPAVIREPDE